MKKIFALLGVLFFLFACGGDKNIKAIKSTLSRYFDAQKNGDKKTMYSLASTPKLMPCESYSLNQILIEPSQKSELSVLKQALAENQKLKKERSNALADLRFDLDQVKETLEKTWNKNKRLELQNKETELRKTIDEKELEVKEANANIYQFQQAINAEEKLINMSYGQGGIVRLDTVRFLQAKVQVGLLFVNGEKKEIDIQLRRYLPTDAPEIEKNLRVGKWIITSIPDDRNFVNLENMDYVDYLFEHLQETYEKAGKRDSSNAIVLTMDETGSFSLNQMPVPSDSLEPRIREIYQSRIDKAIYMRILKNDIPYEGIADLVYILRKAGIEHILPIITDEVKEGVEKHFNHPIDLTVPEELMPIEVPGEIPAEEIESFGVEGGIEGGVVGGVLAEPIEVPEEIPEEEIESVGVEGGVVGDVAREEEAAVRIGGGIKPPKLIKRVAPHYPEIAVKARVQGTVVLEAVTDIYGRVKNVKIIKSNPLLDQAAIDAVRQWVYEPVIINGRPKPVKFPLKVTFSLGETKQK